MPATDDLARSTAVPLGALVVALVGAALTPVAPVLALVLGVVGAVAGVVSIVTAGDDARRRGFGIGATVLGVVAIGLGAAMAATDGDDAPSLVYVGGIGTATPDDTHPPQADVATPIACRVEIGVVRAGGRITNGSDRTARYTVAVVWEQQGDVVAETTTVLDGVTPGQTRTFEVVAPGEGTSGTTCRVTRIDRVAA